MSTVDFDVTDSPKLVRTSNVPALTAFTFAAKCKIVAYQDWGDLFAIHNNVDTSGNRRYAFLEYEAGSGGRLYSVRNESGTGASQTVWTDGYTGNMWIFFRGDGATADTLYLRDGGSFTKVTGPSLTGGFTPAALNIACLNMFPAVEHEGHHRYRSIMVFNTALTDVECERIARANTIKPPRWAWARGLTFWNGCFSDSTVQDDQSGTGGAFTKTGAPTTDADDPSIPWDTDGPGINIAQSGVGMTAALLGSGGTLAADIDPVVAVAVALGGSGATLSASMTTGRQMTAALLGSGGTLAADVDPVVSATVALVGAGGTLSASMTTGHQFTAALLGSGGTIAASVQPGHVMTATLLGAGGALSVTIGGSGPRLAVHAGGRYLIDLNDSSAPFPLLGEAAWTASHNLTALEQDAYFADRAAKGFNAYLMEAIDHNFTASEPPKDIDGNLPFSKRLDAGTYTGSPNGTTGSGGSAPGNEHQYTADPYSNIANEAPDFTWPTEAYWTRLDSFISLAATYGGVVLLYPAYVGFGGGDEGWMDEMVANDAITGWGGFSGQSWADNSKSKMWNYGAWLANRYKNHGNIVWVHGGDYGSGGTSGTFSAPEEAAVNNVFAGMLSVASQLSTLHTAHFSGPGGGGTGLASTQTLAAGTFDLETVYTNTAAAELCHNGYAGDNGPTFEIENPYENSADGGPNRRLTWWAFLSCREGAFFGGYSWRFISGTWDTNLDSQGSRDREVFHNFVQSVSWQGLVPDDAGALVTAGGGTESPQSTSYVAATAAADGSLLVAYVPPAHSGDVTIDMTTMSGAARARWFDPTSGDYTAIGIIANVGTHAFTPPGNNDEGTYDDWVLVLDLADAVGMAAALLGSGGTLGASIQPGHVMTAGLLGSGGTLAADVDPVVSLTANLGGSGATFSAVIHPVVRMTAALLGSGGHIHYVGEGVGGGAGGRYRPPYGPAGGQMYRPAYRPPR